MDEVFSQMISSSISFLPLLSGKCIKVFRQSLDLDQVKGLARLDIYC